MSGCPADEPSVCRAMSRSKRVTCGKSGHTSPTAITIATNITARVHSWSSKAGPEHREPALPSVRPRQRAGRKLQRDLLNDQPIRPTETSLRGRRKGTFAMIAYNTNRNTSDRRASTFVGVDSRAEPSSIQLVNSSTRPAQHPNPVRRTRVSQTLRNGMAERLADIEGLPVLVRVLVQDVPAEMRPDLVTDADVHSLLSTTLEKAIERMRGSPLRRDSPSKQPLAIVE